MSPSKSCQLDNPLDSIPLGLPCLETYQHTMVLMKDKPLNGLPGPKDVTQDGEISNLGCPGSLPLLQTMVLKVIEVQCPQHLQCHLNQTTQMVLDILDMEGGIKKRHI